MKKIAMVVLFLFVTVASFCGWIFLRMVRNENVMRAQKCYEKGENLFKQKKYKEAMWSYQEVNEFYSKPHTNWLDLAQEKEWVCRAYLEDWIPSEGPMSADVRQTRVFEYEKYKAKIAQITPISLVSNIGKK